MCAWRRNILLRVVWRAEGKDQDWFLPSPVGEKELKSSGLAANALLTDPSCQPRIVIFTGSTSCLFCKHITTMAIIICYLYSGKGSMGEKKAADERSGKLFQMASSSLCIWRPTVVQGTHPQWPRSKEEMLSTMNNQPQVLPTPSLRLLRSRTSCLPWELSH